MKTSFTLLKTYYLPFLFLSSINSAFSQSDECAFVSVLNKPIRGGKVIERNNDFLYTFLGNDEPIGVEVEQADGFISGFTILNRPENIKLISANFKFYYTQSITANQRIRVEKFAANSILKWSKSYGINMPASTLNFKVDQVFEGKDHIYISGGIQLEQALAAGKPFVIKIDKQGNVIWKKLYSKEEGFPAYEIYAEDKNGNIYAGRRDFSFKSYLAKIKSNGTRQWEVVSASLTAEKKVRAVVPNAFGTAVFVSSYNTASIPQAFIEKLRASDGGKVWGFSAQTILFPNEGVHQNFGGQDIEGLIATSDGGVVMGYQHIERDGGGNLEYGIGKIKGNGSKAWSSKISGRFDLTPAIESTYGSYIFTGEKNGKFAVVQLTSQGKINPKCPEARSELSDEIVNEDNFTTAIETIAPNPARDRIAVTMQSPTIHQTQVQIVDALGRIVKTHSVDLLKGENVIQFELQSLPAGMYSIFIPGNQSHRKFVKIRD